MTARRVTVLLGFADALSAPEAAASLARNGVHVVAYARRGARPALRKRRDVEIVPVSPPESDAERTVADLRRLAETVEPAVAMPLDDLSVWLCDRAFGDGSLPIAGPSGDAARFALDKRLQIAAARRAGFSTPETRIYEHPTDVDARLDFPVVVKPALAVSQVDGRLRRESIRVSADERELEAALGRLSPSEPVLVQPLLRGVGEGLFGLAAPREIGWWSAHRRVRMMNPQGSGSSACESITPDPALLGPARRLLEGAGWRGVFMIELLRDRAGTPWFMEFNGRPWGSLALARRLGFEYPAWAVRQLFDPDFAPPAPTHRAKLVCRHAGRELVHLLFVLRGPESGALTEWPSRWRTLRAVASVRRSDRWYNWEPRNGSLALFLDDFVQTVVSQVRGR